MSETETTDVSVVNNKLSITFERKLSDGNYGSIGATAWVQGEIPPGASPQEVATEAANLFSAAKAAVLDELGIEWGLDDNGTVREKVTPFVSATHAEAGVKRAFQGTQDTGGSGGLRVMNAGKEGVSSDPLPDWLIKDAAKAGITAVWDQRHTAAGNQPLFKEAVARGAVGQGKDGQAKGFWPPK